MAIFNVNESSLSKYLNEHGGLRNRLLKNHAEAVKNHSELQDRYDTIEKSANNKQKEKIKNLRKHDEGQSLKKVKAAEKEVTKLTDNMDKYKTKPIHDYEAVRKATEDYLKQKEKEHISRGINSGKKTINLSKKQPNQYKDLADARKKLGEAAEYMLDILNEIEYNKKSNSINKKIISIIKNIISAEIININKSKEFKDFYNSLDKSYFTEKEEGKDLSNFKILIKNNNYISFDYDWMSQDLYFAPTKGSIHVCTFFDKIVNNIKNNSEIKKITEIKRISAGDDYPSIYVLFK